MVQLLLDDNFRMKLDEIRVPTELCDKAGRVLGVFTPAVDPDRKWYEWAKSQHTEQDEIELERIAQEKPDGRTLQEILKSLRDS